MTDPVRPRPSPSVPVRPAVPDRLFLDLQSALAGRYALELELGRGGMGVVFLARDLRLERVVAIKLLPPDRARDGALRERFLREARMAARLSHPHVVPIHAVEEAGAFVFFVMAYVEGETLGARIRRDGALKPREAARVLREVAWALAYAHAQGVIHRDVKPDNILLEARTGRALVADFGIARLTQAPGTSGEGELAGTPEYMSPEQASGEAVDGRSDLYALGVVGYYALSGRLPFTAPTVPAVLLKQVSEAPPSLVAPGAPRSLVAAIERCLAKDPARRFESGEQLADALAVEAQPEVPLPVRAFLAEQRPEVRLRFVTPFLAAAVLVPIGLGIITDLVFSGAVPAPFNAGVIAIGAVLAAVGAASPLFVRLQALRRYLRSGYAREDLEHALRRERERHREELEFVFGAGGGPSRFERLMTLKSRASLALAAACALGAFVLPYPAIQIALGGFVMGSATAVATGIAAREAGRRRLGILEDRNLKAWSGWWGRLCFRLAAWRLGRRPAALPPADRPTELALRFAALDLFEALPAEMRRALGDVPAVVRGLEDHARRLRAAAEDSGPAREQAGQRLREAHTALETIRLDLLRLQGGVGTVDSLTTDLEAARGVGEGVDRLINGWKETERDGRGR